MGVEQHRVCQVCGAGRLSELRRGILVGPAVAELVRKATGSWSDTAWICTDDLHRYRHEYVKSLLEAERGELTALDNEVLESLRQQEILSRNPEEELQAGLTTAQRAADRLAAFGGSYQVNLKAELEIRHLHQKIDHLLSHQWERLVEIQGIQMESINETRSHKVIRLCCRACGTRNRNPRED